MPVLGAREQLKTETVALLAAGRQESGERDARGSSGDPEGDPGSRRASGCQAREWNHPAAPATDSYGQLSVTSTT